MKHEVFWKNPSYKSRPELKQDIECEYLIVGGGITGVSLAYFLSIGGAKNIVLIEKKTIGSGATGKSAGILVLKGEIDLSELIRLFGRKNGLVYWNGNKEGLEIVKGIIKKEKLNCDFEPQNTIFGGMHEGDHDYVMEEYEVEKTIEKDSKLISGDELKKYLNTPLFKHALLSKNHGISINPLKHVRALAKVSEKRGVKIYEKTALLKTKKDTALTYFGKIKFNKMIKAVDVDYKKKEVKNRKSTIAVTQKLSNEQLKKIGLLEKKFVWDSEDEYHYLKITKDNRILLGFGDKIVSRSQRKTHPHYAHLKDIKGFLKNLFPQIKLKIKYAWSGNFGTTPDLIPVIDKKGNQLAIAGCGSQVVCVMSAKYMADKILNKKSNLDEFFRL